MPLSSQQGVTLDIKAQVHFVVFRTVEFLMNVIEKQGRWTLTVTVEQTDALSANSHYVQLLIGVAGDSKVLSWSSSMFEGPRENEITRALGEKEVALIRQSVETLRVKVGALPDNSRRRACARPKS